MTKSLYFIYFLVLIVFFIIINSFLIKKELFQLYRRCMLDDGSTNENTPNIIRRRDVIFQQEDANEGSSNEGVSSGSENSLLATLPVTSLTRQTVSSDDNSECCGVTIYENSLNNINKCIDQHISPGDNQVEPAFQDWNEINDTNTCRSPHNVLARTSNCSNLVSDLSNNIDNLLQISQRIENSDSSNCNYNYLLNQQKRGDSLTDHERFLLWQKNIPCEFRPDGGTAQDAQIFEFGNNDNVEYTYFNCE